MRRGEEPATAQESHPVSKVAAADVIVVGLGGMGSAAAAELAARTRRVLGFDAFFPPHEHGSSHGRSRVIRQAYFEDPAYVPLLLRAYELWQALEQDCGSGLLTITGGLMLGAPESEVVAGSLRSAVEHGLAHELLDAREIRRRFPELRPGAGTVALYEKNAGFVLPEAAVSAQLSRATRLGATLRTDEPVLAWEASGRSVRVTTAQGSYEAEQLVVAAGAWVAPVVTRVAPWVVERQVQHWFEPAGAIDAFLPDRFPIWIWETDEGLCPYGFPAMDGLVKVALHHGGEDRVCTADSVDRTVGESEIDALRACLRERVPRLAGRWAESKPCLYTSTPDGHFVIDRHPEHSNVWIVSPCSGHGFKFAPVIGEIVAELVVDGRTRHEIAPFRLDRFQRA